MVPNENIHIKKSYNKSSKILNYINNFFFYVYVYYINILILISPLAIKLDYYLVINIIFLIIFLLISFKQQKKLLSS